MVRQEVSKDEARQIVRQIAKGWGWIGEDDELWKESTAEGRRRFEAALLEKDTVISSLLNLISRDLYSNSVRFVFELLQNADDNDYDEAIERGDVPCASFRVTNEAVVFECNEDGFSPANVRALCSVSKSSKTAAHGYIGNKGIGFKSVFTVAEKVSIQSGNFSFYFKQKKGDPGIRMMIPVWEESKEKLPGPLTRMTLYFPSAGDDLAFRIQRRAILDQLRGLQTKMLLFLRKIQRIDVNICDFEGITSLMTYSIKPGPDGLVLLQKDNRQSGVVEETDHFYVVKHLATGLPKGTREYTDEDSAKKAYSVAELTLAFPPSKTNYVPDIKNQWLYAFLPLKPFLFSFLIHADFDTGANRQDITDGPRNIELRENIATAFVKAVHQFNKHPTLRYKWMRYLPERSDTAQRNDEEWGTLWGGLSKLIADKLGEADLLFPATEAIGFSRDSRKIADFRYLDPGYCDRDGRPLFPNAEPGLYPSEAYARDDLKILLNYGLEKLTRTEFFSRVENDLNRPNDFVSRMKSPFTSEEWHSRAAQALNLPFNSDGQKRTQKYLKTLALVPLQNLQWTSMTESDSPVYYPKVQGATVPTDIGLRILNSFSVKNADRMALFENLGVRVADVKAVRRGPRDVFASSSHLHFLYLTDRLRSPHDDLTTLEVFVQDETRTKPAKSPVYIKTKEFDELLRPTVNAPGLKLSFLHEVYFTLEPHKPEEQKMTWIEWLHASLKIQRRLPIVEVEPFRRTNFQLSSTCRYLAEHRHDQLLNLLRTNWKFEAEKIKASPEVLKALRQIQLSNQSDVDLFLGHCYLPTTTAKKLVAKYLGAEDNFPWLPIKSEEDGIPAEWYEIMKDLETGCLRDDIDFGLCILDCVIHGKYGEKNLPRSAGLPDKERIYKLYQYLEHLASQSENPKDSQRKIRRDYFANNAAIYIPTCAYNQACWADIDDCLWLAPSHMKSRYPLASLYKEDWRIADEDLIYLGKFFKSTIGMSDASQECFIEELEYLRDNKLEDLAVIRSIYQELENTRNSASQRQAYVLWDAFRTKKLIYASGDLGSGWYVTSDCIWSAATQIADRVALNESYSELEVFFVQFLGVETLTLKMVLKELKRKAEMKVSVDEMKKGLWCLNSFLRSEKSPPDFKTLAQSKIFPVISGSEQSELMDSSSKFALIDREPLRKLFAAHAAFLDFNFDETRRLEPLITWAGLQSRYLSTSVREHSEIERSVISPLSSRSRKISTKAHALLRIAVHFDSSRSRFNEMGFYETLRGIQVFEADKISSKLYLYQDGNAIADVRSTGELHIDPNGPSPKIYLLSDEKSQRRCYLSLLPRRLLEWMLSDPNKKESPYITDKAVMAVKTVLMASRVDISQILDDEGIVNVETQDIGSENEDDEVREEQEAVEEQRDYGKVSETRGNRSEEFTSPTTTLSSSSGMVIATSSVTSSTTYLRARETSRSTTSIPTPISPPPNSGSELATTTHPRVEGRERSTPNNDYVDLLDRIIRVAPSFPFPSYGAFNMQAMAVELNSLLGSLGENEEDKDDWNYRSGEQRERDFRVGAAGELFVFLLLKGISPSLPHFDEDNWQSRILKYVKVHPTLGYLPEWNHKETADITYNDSQGVLTNLFIGQGYLDSDAWNGKKPMYFIEVKTTTRSFNTRFFMSRSQYARMQDLSNGEDGREKQESIYVIFRVHDLGKANMGLRIYMDPETLRVRPGAEAEAGSKLLFREETYSVVPSNP
ncbi:hypothetical protein GQ53DRAFT_855993 [Thozetella sp. PMI_491]|nr:hypothetical protein GQ53DRAFT_855993 [Thozetella sp. PMI_491]